MGINGIPNEIWRYRGRRLENGYGESVIGCKRGRVARGLEGESGGTNSEKGVGE